jgi:hypothetical protein
LADYSPRIHAKALQPDKVFALRVRLDYTGKETFPAHDALEDVKACKRCIPVLVENGIIELKPKEYPAEQLKFNPEPEPAKTKKVKREVLVHDPKPIFAPDAEPENKVAKLLNETDF